MRQSTLEHSKETAVDNNLTVGMYKCSFHIWKLQALIGTFIFML